VHGCEIMPLHFVTNWAKVKIAVPKKLKDCWGHVADVSKGRRARFVVLCTVSYNCKHWRPSPQHLSLSLNIGDSQTS